MDDRIVEGHRWGVISRSWTEIAISVGRRILEAGHFGLVHLDKQPTKQGNKDGEIASDIDSTFFALEQGSKYQTRYVDVGVWKNNGTKTPQNFQLFRCLRRALTRCQSFLL